MNNKEKNKRKEYTAIAVSHDIKKRFEYLKCFFINRSRTNITGEELLIELMDFFENKRNVNSCSDRKE